MIVPFRLRKQQYPTRLHIYIHEKRKKSRLPCDRTLKFVPRQVESASASLHNRILLPKSFLPGLPPWSTCRKKVARQFRLPCDQTLKLAPHHVESATMINNTRRSSILKSFLLGLPLSQRALKSSKAGQDIYLVTKLRNSPRVRLSQQGTLHTGSSSQSPSFPALKIAG